MMTADHDWKSTSLLTRIQRLSEDTNSVPNLESKTEGLDKISGTSLSHQLDINFGDLKT